MKSSSDNGLTSENHCCTCWSRSFCPSIEQIQGEEEIQQHITEAAQAGANIATTPFKVLQQLFHHPLTAKGIEGFLADWAKREEK